ncbi:hypothetical protein PFISCL1PPCAC_12842, partial [Pristionchus fissidentatus]
RFERFSSVMRSAVSKDESSSQTTPPTTQAETPGEDASSRQLIEPSPFMDHKCFSNLPSTSNVFFDNLKKGYGLFCTLRRCGELGTSLRQLSGGFQLASETMLVPATYSHLIPNARIAGGALLEMANSSYPDFQKLSDEDKKCVAQRRFLQILSLDRSYRSAHYFPHEDTIVLNYCTVMNEKVLTTFFDDCPSTINKADAMDEVKRSLRHALLLNKRNFLKVRPTNEEFLALIGLLLWADEISNENEALSSIAERNRAEILSQLHDFYLKQGVHEYATRLGDVLCLIESMEKMACKMQEDFHLYRLMNFFDEDFEK